MIDDLTSTEATMDDRYGQWVERQPCLNPACDRDTTAEHCCDPCVRADRDGWDIDGEHSLGCDARHVTRR